MNTILEKYLVFIKLNQFMTSYLDHTHIHLASKEKYVAGSIEKNPEDFFIEVGFLHSLQQPLVLVVTKTQGDPETTSSAVDRRVCLTPILKRAIFRNKSCHSSF